jgi:hypothetical protein
MLRCSNYKMMAARDVFQAIPRITVIPGERRIEYAACGIE